MRRFAVWILALLLFGNEAALAQCTTLTEATAVRRSLHRAMRCRERQLRAGAGEICGPFEPPACAGSLVSDAVTLAYGPANPPTGIDPRSAPDAYRCQRHIGRAVRSYVSRRLTYSLQGITPVIAEGKASLALQKLSTRCAVRVSRYSTDTVLPFLGPQCAAAVGAPGRDVDPDALRACLQKLLATWVQRSGPSPQPLRPNIVFILTDDQRWDTTDERHAPAGQRIMPKLHAEIGESGVQFLNAFMTTPLCCPSRTSTLRGEYSHTTGVHSNAGVHGGAHVFDDSLTMGTILRSAGYRTGFYGKYLNGYDALWTTGQPPYVPPGWDEWHAFKNVQYFNYDLVRNGVGYDHVEQHYGSAATDYSTDVLRELAKQFIESSVALRQPFFLYLAPKAPHLPRQPAPRHVGKYTGLPNWRPGSYNEAVLQLADMPEWVRNASPLNVSERADLDSTVRSQLEMLQAVDEMIGGSETFGITGVMQTLRAFGIADQTLIVFLSDNGYMWGEHRLTAKNKPYEEAIRAPMFVRYPPLAPLKRLDENLLLNIDLCPTFAALAGAATPPGTFEGRNFERVLDGTETVWRTDFATEGWALGREWVSVRDDEWKYIETTDSRLLPVPPIETELYNVVQDPLEQSNVAAFVQHAGIVTRLATRLRQLRPAWPQDSSGDPEVEEE